MRGLHLNALLGHRIDPGAGFRPTAGENERVLADVVKYGQFKITLVGRG